MTWGQIRLRLKRDLPQAVGDAWIEIGGAAMRMRAQ